MKRRKLKSGLLALAFSMSLGLNTISAVEHSIHWLPEGVAPVGNTKMESYEMPYFSQGLMVVSQQVEGVLKHGYLNQEGNYVIAPTFSDAKPFSEGLAPAKALVLLSDVEERLYGLIPEPEVEEESEQEEDNWYLEGEEEWENNQNKPEEKPDEDDWYLEGEEEWENAQGDLTAGAPLPRMESLESQSRMMERESVEQSSEEFVEEVPEPQWVERYGYIDVSGNFVIPPTYEDAFGFSGGLAAVELAEGFWGFIDTSGKLRIGGDFSWVHDFEDGYAIVKKGNVYGLVDRYGNYVFDLLYNGIGGGDGIYPVRVNRLYGLMDLSGNLVQVYQYENMGFFQEELALVESNGKWGYVDNLGNLVISIAADQSFHFQEGVAWVRHQGHCYYIDSSGRAVLVMEELDELTSFSEGYARGKDGHFYGFFDKTGKTILPFQYRDAVPVSEGVGLVFNGTSWGLFYPEHRGSAWADSYIEQADALELIPTHFQGVDLSAPINRTQFASLVVTLYDLLVQSPLVMGDFVEEPSVLPSLSENRFEDTRDPWVRSAFALHLTSGLSETEFGAYDNLNREQAATMFVTLYEAVTGQNLVPQGAPNFQDHEEISWWAQENVYILAEKGILTGVGDNYFAPQDPISGESALVMALALCSDLKYK